MTTAEQLFLFWSKLYVLLDTDCPCLGALQVCYQLLPNGPVKRRLRTIIKKMTSDNWTFADALAASKLATRLEVNMVRAGEVGGMPEVIVHRLVDEFATTAGGQYQNFFKKFRMLITSGVPLLTTLKVIQEETSLPILRNAIGKIYDSLKEGSEISTAMRQSHAFTDFEIKMVEIGEQSGQLDMALLKISNSRFSFIP